VIIVVSPCLSAASSEQTGQQTDPLQQSRAKYKTIAHRSGRNCPSRFARIG
jgi:hypothetical protein